MKFTFTKLLILFTTSSNILTSADTCLEYWDLSVEGCDYEKLVSQLQAELPGTCPHNAERELQLALDVDSEDEVKEIMQVECSEGYFPWEGISKKGYVFDKAVFDGGTYYNEERESLDEYGIPQHRLKDDPGARIKLIHDEIAREKGIEFPDYLTHFENCELRAAMCCFVQDRQANDNNGNCKEPYEEKCLDADPADNTDICYHDMENSPTSSRTESGFVVFEEEDDGDSHCHGIAWAEDGLDPTARYKGNNLFYVTLYDHLFKRGYVGNVPGAPKCACIEQMPVVTRSDCTQVDTTNEEFDFMYYYGDFNVTLVNVDIDFNSCQGANNNNNDLEAYYEQLTNDGKASETELAELRSHLVGETYCREAIDEFLKEKGVIKTPACEGSDPESCGCGEVDQADYRGTIATTISGRTCQRWDSNEPHSHSRKRANYPNAGLEENYCRNPDGEPSNWCYTTDINKRWDFCYVPLCGCSATLAGETCGCGEVGQADYRGTISTTASGLECQRWDTKDPHTHNRTPQNFPDSDLSENYCRNPDGEPATWCYTTDPNKRWDYCDVPVCDCHECDDTPTARMIRRGETCATEIDDLDDKCNKHGAWISNNYCELSCFNSGNGYYGSNCCNGSEL